MTLTNLIIYALAIWRISSLLVHEDGPGYIFQRIRQWTGIKHDEEGTPWEIPGTFLAQLFSCVWCMSIWVSFFMTLFWLISPEWSLRMSVIFAFSATAIFIDTKVRKT